MKRQLSIHLQIKSVRLKSRFAFPRISLAFSKKSLEHHIILNLFDCSINRVAYRWRKGFAGKKEMSCSSLSVSFRKLESICWIASILIPSKKKIPIAQSARLRNINSISFYPKKYREWGQAGPTVKNTTQIWKATDFLEFDLRLWA